MTNKPELRYKVEINPSYEWAKGMEESGISHRELEVFALVVEGYKNSEVAEILHIKYQSVKNHIHHFTQKLGVKNSFLAMIIALEKRLIKVRGIRGVESIDLTPEGVLEDFKKLIDGQIWFKGVDEKGKRKVRVFFLSHGIDLDKLEGKGEKKPRID
jgi:DNA-binding CsgD family transcriptional regulator